MMDLFEKDRLCDLTYDEFGCLFETAMKSDLNLLTKNEQDDQAR